MSQRLSWQNTATVLSLRGELTAETLQPLWQQRKALAAECQQIDVSELSRVDSAGVALLFHLQQQSGREKPALTGVTDKLQTLLDLYNLAPLMSPSSVSQ